MEAYTSFAEVYDRFMDNVPYDKWCEVITSYLKEFNIDDGLVLDLGCGTGTLTAMLSELGYDMIGVDMSEDMLAMAMEKSGYDSGILYLCQDMREFELYGTVRAIVSACDSMNYLTEDKDLKTVFALAQNYLDYDGIFVFDMNTKYKYEKLLADNTFAENREECSFIWENSYDEQSQINQYDLTLFVKAEGEDSYENTLCMEDDADDTKRVSCDEGNADDTENTFCDEINEEDIEKEAEYEDVYADDTVEDEMIPFYRYREIHYQKAYDLEIVKEYIKESGLILEAVYDGYTHDAVRDDSERVTFIARKPGIS